MIDFSINRSIEITMAPQIGDFITISAMTTYGQRVREARSKAKLSQGQLARELGVSQPTLHALETNQAATSSKHTYKIAKATGANPAWLETGHGSMFWGEPAARDPVAISSQAGTVDRIKVLGLAECGEDGWALWNGEVVDTVPRPAQLVGAPNGFAVYTLGSSMEPRYFAGELVYIHPGKPVQPGNFVLVQLHPKEEGNPPRAVLKRLVRRSASRVVLEQYNPPKTFNITPDEVVSIMRAVGSGEG